VSEFNLIPADYAREQALRRRLRWAIASFIVLGCLVVAARTVLGVLVAGEREELTQLQAKKRQWQENKARTEKYAAEALAAEKQLLALDELRGREHLRLFLEALDGAYVDKVWFDDIKYYRREAPVPPKGTGVAAAQRVEQRVGMTGHATSHVTLAEFMRRLESQPAVAELALVDTSPRSYPNALIIDFKLGLLVERKAKVLP
jgi:hypothetical protein